MDRDRTVPLRTRIFSTSDVKAKEATWLVRFDLQKRQIRVAPPSIPSSASDLQALTGPPYLPPVAPPPAWLLLPLQGQTPAPFTSVPVLIGDGWERRKPRRGRLRHAPSRRCWPAR